MRTTWHIHLVRHGIAAERGADWPDDGRRPLTARGIARFTRAAQGAVRYGVAVDRICSSPLVRARETADLLAAVLPVTGPVITLDSLGPGHLPSEVTAELGTIDPGGSVALVGHEPDLGTLAAFLIGAERPLPFRKGGMCRIDVEDLTGRPDGRLRWLMEPRALRLLAR